MPLSLVIAGGVPSDFEGIPRPVSSTALPCPICMSGNVRGIQLFPLAFWDLERAVELRKLCAQGASRAANAAASGTGKRMRDDMDTDVPANAQPESSYIMLSSCAVGSRDRHHDRTGRWSTEEIAYVDQLVAGFDQGVLPLPHGIKLNEFLGEMLLCKSSRLTKKMKNAKLSTRSFILKGVFPQLSDDQCVSLSTLQNNFLQTGASDAMQLELKFNITKLWRTHFSNLCLQIGYDFLDATEWLLSLEELERRAAEAEEVMRVARRRRMGLALRQDIGPSSNDGVFIGGIPAKRDNVAPPVAISSQATPAAVRPTPMKPDMSSTDPFHFLDDHHASAGQSSGTSTHQRRFSEEVSMTLLDELMCATGDSRSQPFTRLRDCGPFLENVIHFIENDNLPFEHADVWVPSFAPDATNSSGEKTADSLRLYHAGHATRSDINPALAYQVREYGAYSTNFSFAPGVGLPGRVYANNKSSWECKVNDADPARFERAGGAQVYGVKTAVGIPLEAPVVGRIVVALYSTSEIAEDPSELQRFADTFSQWTPMPKWSLEIELGQIDHHRIDSESLVAITQPACSNLAMKTLSATPSAFSSVNRQDIAAQALVGLTHQQATKSSTVSMDDDRDQQIASILGDHMPGNQNDSMLQHFMSLRLLLLRPSDRRSEQENDSLDVVKRSFSMYSESKQRSGAELASLLVRDWIFLSAPSQATPPSFPALQPPHQQHIQPTNMLPQPMMPTSSSQQMQWLAPPAPYSPRNTLQGMSNGKQLMHWQHSSLSSSLPYALSNGNENKHNGQQSTYPELSTNGMSQAAALVPKSPRD